MSCRSAGEGPEQSHFVLARLQVGLVEGAIRHSTGASCVFNVGLRCANPTYKLQAAGSSNFILTP